jgi:predicted metal-dependent hydrolase
MGKDYVIFKNKKIEYSLHEKDIKNISLKVTHDKNITLSVPYDTSTESVRKFLFKKLNWINKQIKYFDENFELKENLSFENGETIYLLGKQYKMKIEKSSKNSVFISNNYVCIKIKDNYFNDKKYIKKVYKSWLREYAKFNFKTIVLKYQPMLKRHGMFMPEVEVRNMKSRWGSCISPKNKIVLNSSLIKTPMCCIEYVILHELTHLRYKKHNKEFYNFITIFMPDWKDRKKTLDQDYCGII